jgi:hypothetical protein
MIAVTNNLCGSPQVVRISAVFEKSPAGAWGEGGGVQMGRTRSPPPEVAPAPCKLLRGFFRPKAETFRRRSRFCNLSAMELAPPKRGFFLMWGSGTRLAGKPRLHRSGAATLEEGSQDG